MGKKIPVKGYYHRAKVFGILIVVGVLVWGVVYLIRYFS